MKWFRLFPFYLMLVSLFIPIGMAESDEIIALRTVVEDKQNVLNAINERIQAKQTEWEQADENVQNNLIETTSYSGNGLLAEIYNNQGYNASPPLPSVDRKISEKYVPNIDFQWNGGMVLDTLYEDVAVKFTGTITSTTDDTVTFYAPGDDGVKLYIDGELIINDWIDKGGGGSQSPPITFQANTPKQITLWFYENGGGANVWLYWNNVIVPAEAFKTVTTETSLDPQLLTIANNLKVELESLIDERDIAIINLQNAQLALDTALQQPEPSIEPTPEPTIEPTPQPTPQPTIEPIPEPIVEPTIEPTIEPLPIIEPIFEPPVHIPVHNEPIQPVISVPEVVVEPMLPINVEPIEPPIEVVEPIVEPQEPIVEQETEVVEPVIEPAVEPVIEPIVETIVEQIEVPIVEEVTTIIEPTVAPIETPIVEVIQTPSQQFIEPIQSVFEPVIEPIIEATPQPQIVVEQEPLVPINRQSDVEIPEVSLDATMESISVAVEFFGDLFTDPSVAVEQLMKLGSDMTEEERETARQVVIPTILVSNIISTFSVRSVRV